MERMQDTAERVAGRVAEWLLRERHLVCTELQRAGSPTFLEDTVYIGAPADTGVSFRQHAVRRSPAAIVPLPLFAIHVKWPQDRELLRETAQLIIDTYGASCGRWTNLRYVTLASDPTTWVSDVYLLPVRDEYLRTLADLAIDNPVLANSLGRRVCDAIEASEHTGVVRLYLDGISLPEGMVEVGPLSVRDLTPEEMGELRGIQERQEPDRSEWEHVYHRHSATLDRVAVDLRHTVSKFDYPRASESRWLLLLGLFLIGFEPGGTGIYREWHEPSFPPARIRGEELLPHAGHTKPYRTAEAVELLHTLERCQPIRLLEPQCARDVAFGSYLRSCIGKTHSRALVDVSVGLEALFLADEKTELGYKLRMRAAAYVGSGPDRWDLRNQLRDIYAARSRLVHGTSPPSPKDVLKLADAGRAILRAGLTRSLREGWPDAAALDKMLLGIQ